MNHLPQWEILRMKYSNEVIGFLPVIILNEAYDSRPVVEQVNARYGGGWHSMKGFKWNRIARTIRYPGDPPLHAVARFEANEKEVVYVFDGGWVLIDRGLDDYEIARMD